MAEVEEELYRTAATPLAEAAQRRDAVKGRRDAILQRRENRKGSLAKQEASRFYRNSNWSGAEYEMKVTQCQEEGSSRGMPKK